MFTMGMKTKAAVAIVILLVLLGSMWLQGGLDNHWHSCLTGFPKEQKPVIITILNDTDTDSERAADIIPLGECPGQDFQVSRLLSHLLAAPVSTSDVLLLPYLSSWDELIRFMKALGPMVGLISQEIDGKTSIIRQLAREDAERQKERAHEEEDREGKEHIHAKTDGKVEEMLGPQTGIADPMTEGKGFAGEEQGFPDFGESYLSVRSMIRLELSQGTVSFEEQTDSGCRTLLRLHRALLWLQLFLKKLAEKPEAGMRLRSPSELCREAYQQTLAHHHTWLVRRAAELAFLAMPDRGFFIRLVCGQDQEEAASVLNRVVRAIGEVYQRTQGALEVHGMLKLP
ncbi:hypothetical protein SKAU_G00262830 [Synaphobranchus kaupii]|uniref:Glycolipid transfer protein domain-containing protein n=1 Tax=Synaphobranchus kaupii TaxID=118154 RepID=A0A9Q1EYL8_SYNKA|nr:hypothetical protein SKAU_G00262830 [Synaphobranchus kaupii]